MKKNLVKALSLLLVTLLCVGGVTSHGLSSALAESAGTETVDIQILATSDLHGKFLPWNYILDVESPSGSMTQLATAIREKRNENTLVLDAGDVIQDNLAAFFVGDEVHPMVMAMNYIGYDAWTTGNHEYNYGISVLKKVIASNQAPLLLANVYDENGQRLGKPYAIFERGGVRIAVIGVVTPNITHWDAANLANCIVTNPVEECKKLLPEIADKADVFIALAHMGLNGEYGTPGSGALELAEACPEFSLIIAAHDHNIVEGETHGNVLIVENKNQAQTMSEIHLTVEKSDTGCKVTNITSASIAISGYESDAELTALLQPAHARALEESHKVIGKLEGGNLLPENEIQGIPIAQLQDTALVDLITNAQLFYSGADVTSVCLTHTTANLKMGNIRNCDLSNVYKYDNTLYNLQMTGAQLKTYMEWSANYYQQYQDGDLTIAFNPSMRSYM